MPLGGTPLWPAGSPPCGPAPACSTPEPIRCGTTISFRELVDTPVRNDLGAASRQSAYLKHLKRTTGATKEQLPSSPPHDHNDAGDTYAGHRRDDPFRHRLHGRLSLPRPHPQPGLLPNSWSAFPSSLRLPHARQASRLSRTSPAGRRLGPNAVPLVRGSALVAAGSRTPQSVTLTLWATDVTERSPLSTHSGNARVLCVIAAGGVTSRYAACTAPEVARVYKHVLLSRLLTWLFACLGSPTAIRDCVSLTKPPTGLSTDRDAGPGSASVARARGRTPSGPQTIRRRTIRPSAGHGRHCPGPCRHAFHPPWIESLHQTRGASNCRTDNPVNTGIQPSEAALITCTTT